MGRSYKAAGSRNCIAAMGRSYIAAGGRLCVVHRISSANISAVRAALAVMMSRLPAYLGR
jgi:hypothetical protein